jgi:ADP-ribose pyrophosphatase
VKPYETVATELIYTGKIFNVTNLTIQLPNGKQVKHDLIVHNGASAIVPVLGDGRILLERQYRESVGAEILEVPAGRLEPGEDPAECARRELEEETGYRAEKITLLTKFFPCVGYSNEQIYLYVAEGLTPGPARPDEDEFVTPEAYTLEEALKMTDNGAIVDGKTSLAILAYARYVSNVHSLTGE